jgi:chemotaxis protein MotB
VEPEFREVATKLEQYRLAENIQARVRVTFDERGMIIQLDNNLLFPPGSAELTPEARKLLDRVGAMLIVQPNHVRIEGHTDDTPIHTDRYPSNWQLSTDRATNVIMYWADQRTLPPDRLSAAGYGQYRPVVPNDSPEHRALNRRVEVVILRTSAIKFEPKDKSNEPPANADAAPQA